MMKEQEKTPSSSPPKSLCIADIVASLNGRDAGKRFIVIGTDPVYSLIADGKGRRYEKPKKKKNKHLKFEDKADSYITEKLEKGDRITNNEIRRFLAAYRAKEHDEGGMLNAKG